MTDDPRLPEPDDREPDDPAKAAAYWRSKFETASAAAEANLTNLQTLKRRFGVGEELRTEIRPDSASKPHFYRSDLADSRFYAEHRDAILDAAAHGRIHDDKSGWRVRDRKGTPR